MRRYYSACVKKSHQSESGKIPINIPQNDHEYGPITSLLTDAAVQMSCTVKKKDGCEISPSLLFCSRALVLNNDH